ncbi:hypothetical protein EYF80_043574 [Liparis tanakae]|uniref:Uncharacterized protein n=1 Tax=Liparis tanakae TaxID=230148 RepID=A0A4Z2G087_9TELE|nr:hypothetical protein EYF80_043574 [Liparis tanakae]
MSASEETKTDYVERLARISWRQLITASSLPVFKTRSYTAARNTVSDLLGALRVMKCWGFKDLIDLRLEDNLLVNRGG